MRRPIALACLALVSLPLAASGPVPGNGPTEVAARYLGHLESGRPFAAVDDCFDARAFAHRVFGADLDRLPPDEAAYVVQLCSVALKASATLAPLEQHSTPKQPDLAAAADGNDAIVSLPGADRPGTRTMLSRTLRLQHAGGDWKITDAEIAGSMAENYAGLKRVGGMGPTEYMEATVINLLGAKLRPRAAQRRDQAQQLSRQDAVRAQILTQWVTLQNQIELYRARENKYPDFASGWDPLIRGGYIKKAPVNAANGRSEIRIGKAGSAESGWQWDPQTHTLSASYFDEATESLTLDTP